MNIFTLKILEMYVNQIVETFRLQNPKVENQTAIFSFVSCFLNVGFKKCDIFEFAKTF